MLLPHSINNDWPDIERRIKNTPVPYDRREQPKTMREVKIQLAIGTMVLFTLGVSVGMWIASQIVGAQ